ncbi:MAG: phytoene/squalene synthase family protein [Candidatus Binatia bacterium]
MSHSASPKQLLYYLLPRVSRSFYLSVRVLPSSLRPIIGLAYLFCRAADTIADTALLPRAQRRTYLEQYRTVFATGEIVALGNIHQHLTEVQHNVAERELLRRLPDCFRFLRELSPDDQQHICQLVTTLTQGMQLDLTLFPGETEGRVGALEAQTDLDRYTYFVAGCVGEFWTRVVCAHVPRLQQWDVPSMERKGMHFGKGLQMTNILRDLAHDIRVGRCYFPRRELMSLGVQPKDLREPTTVERIRPLLDDLLELTLSYYRDGWEYTLAIPPREWRLRLACAWPLLIGLSTLALVRRSPDLLNPTIRIKITRGQVYGIIFRSLAVIGSNQALDRYYQQLLASGGLVEPGKADIRQTA